MRKDYLPVDSVPDMSETAFVAEYWTRKWQGAAFKDSPEAYVRRQEEFRVMDPYLRKLAPGSRLLDGGCGMGEWTRYYTAQGYDVTGLDLSRPTVERLTKAFPQCRFLAGDIRNTGFPAGSFDAYFSWGTFEHFEDGLGGCLREAARLLRPDGYLFCSVPFHNRRHLLGDRRALKASEAHFDPELGYAKPMRFYQWRLTRSEFERELEIHGFRTLEVHPIHLADGFHRFLKNDLRLAQDSLPYRLLMATVRRAAPRASFAHMVMAVGQKR